MAIKIYVSGNALRAEDTSSGVNVLDVPKSRVYYENNFLNQTTPRVRIEYLPPNEDEVVLDILLSDAVDEDLVAFTAATFRDFCNANLGFDQDASGSAPLDPDNGTEIILETSGQPLNGFSGASDFDTDAIELRNAPFIFYAESTHTTGTPTVTMQFSSDASTWFTYKDQENVSISETFFDDEFYPQYFRISYVANSSNGNITFRISTL